MDVFQLIKGRRSIPRFKPDPVPREAVERMLEAATWAPNHHLSEPWEFFVLEGDAKERFARIRRDFRLTLFANPEAPEAQKAAQKIYQDTRATPVVIVVTTRVSKDPDLTDDDYAATWCGVQNMLLVAASLDIGTYPRTGGLIHDPALRAFLGLLDDRRIACIVYAGYPALVPERRRTPYQRKTRWLSQAELPEPVAAGSPEPAYEPPETPGDAHGTVKDPVCGTEVEAGSTPYRSEYKGQTCYFCCPGCQAAFETNPATYAG